MRTCAITGQRPRDFSFRYDETHPDCLALKNKLRDTLVRLYSESYRTFLVGGAVGVDTWAAEILLEMRKEDEYRDLVIKLILAFPEQAERFTKNQKKRYRRIWDRCKPENRITVSEAYSPDAYKKRDYYMVDHCDCLVAVLNEDRAKRTSTGVMVNYSKKNNVPLIIVEHKQA